MRIPRIPALLLLACGRVGWSAPDTGLPALWIDLGATNRVEGLSVPSGGDGVNRAASAGGISCRRLEGPRALYLYVCVDHPAWKGRGPRDLYAAFEVFDEGFTFIRVQYDKADPKPGAASKYTHSPDTALLTGSGKWRRVHFALPQAGLGGGQNNGADLRLHAPGIAVRRIELSAERPADFSTEPGAIGSDALAALAVRRPPGMELTVGGDATPVEAAVFRAVGIGSVESYVHWAGVEPEREGAWDWTEWDAKVRILRTAGLKWVPFLIAGPAYATPLWFQRGPGSSCYRCLEHNSDSGVQSLFNPALPAHIDRFMEAFAARYRDSGVIESLLLGVTGIFGESIYPAGQADGGWTGRLTGPYHNHAGWWVGDRHACVAFRDAMRARYAEIDALNHAWHAHFGSFDEVGPFLPERAPSDRARADFVEWYQQAMTDWSVFWVRTARKHFPGTAIYLCTGGNGDPMLGADFTAQAKAIAPMGAGIRITNEGSDYARNFTLVREVASATRLYGSFAGFEPAASVSPEGIAARIYGASASGVRQLHEYAGNILNPEAMRAFRANVVHLAPRLPRVDAALYAARETWALDPAAIGRLHDIARRLRDITDFRVVTRRSVCDGGLEGCRALLLAESPVLETSAAAAIEGWIRAGGVLVVATRSGEIAGSRLHDNAAWRQRLLAGAEGTRDLLEPRLIGLPPASWSLHVGSDGDAEWLFGDWNNRENAPEWRAPASPRRRWTTARSGILLPSTPHAAHVLRVHASVPDPATRNAGPDENTVWLNGHRIGRLDKPSRGVLEFHAPAEAVGGSSVARLEFRMKTWRPSDHGAGDRRTLGAEVHFVEWGVAGGGAAAPASELHVDWALLPDAVAPLVRRVGKGSVVNLAGIADDPNRLALALSSLFRETGAHLSGERPLAAVDGRLDSRYATRCEGGVFWFDAKTAGIRWEALPELSGPRPANQ